MSDHSLQTPSPEHLAELLPQYDVEYFIAQGGMGAVYKGHQISLDRDIAIKILLQEVSESTEFQDAFISEAKAMAKLNHPNLLGVYDYGTVEGMSYIVMEYVEGGSLHEAAWNQVIDPVQAATIVKGICDGLSHAHKNGIVHRDIKPANILLTKAAEPKVADFGLAHATDSDKTGLMMGTPGYTAPEVFNDPSQAGQLADIYSVGVILHQLLSGIDPTGSMQPPSQSINNIHLDAIWHRATKIVPAQRYPSIEAMAKDLDKWLEAKKNVLSTGTPAPLNPTRQAIPVATGSSGGIFPKVAIICVLVGLLAFAYTKINDKKDEISKSDGYQWVEDDTTIPEDPLAPPEIVSSPLKDPITPPVPTPMDGNAIEKPVIVENNLPETTPEPKPEPKPEPVNNPDPIPEPNLKPKNESKPEIAQKLPPGDPELFERAVGLIQDAHTKRDKELSDNANSLQVSLKALSIGAKPELVTFLDQLKGDIVNNRIPQIDDLGGLPQKLVNTYKQCRTNEESIDVKHFANLTRIRDAYVTRLKGAATETKEEELQQRLLAQAESATDLDAWTQSLSPEPEREPVRVVKRSSGSFVGNWDVHGKTGVERWVAHPGGLVEVVGEKWVAEWVLIDASNLEVRWKDKKPYKMRLVGEDWVGSTSFGSPVTFKRGNW